VEEFEAIAQPTRRKILRLLTGGGLSAGHIASRFAITQPAVSQHLQVLKQSRLVGERREGTRRLYSIRPDGLSELDAFLSGLLPGRLGRLKQAAEEEQRAADGHGAEQN
jgi:DNA-binding transcriptional ArsR family regulator